MPLAMTLENTVLRERNPETSSRGAHLHETEQVGEWLPGAEEGTRGDH